MSRKEQDGGDDGPGPEPIPSTASFGASFCFLILLCRCCDQWL